MNQIKRLIAPMLFFSTLAVCGLQIGRSATAAPVTVPIAKDILKASRDAGSRVPGDDERQAVPSSQGLIGGNGVVEPKQRETRVAAQVSALIKKVLVVEGQKVNVGDMLVELEDGVERASLLSAEADVSAERANYARATKGLRIEDRDAVSAEAQAAKSRAELSAGVLSRTEQLAKTGAATQDELDRARRTAQTDQASAKAGEARARAAEAGSRGEDIAFARARLLAAEARAVQAKAVLERLVVKAPLAGEVLQVKVREGELYSFGGAEPLVVMGDTSRLKVRMDVDERDIAKVRAGASAFVTADAFGSTRFTGTVVEIGRRFGRKNVRTDDPVERNDTKVLEVLIELDEASMRLVPGQRVTSFVNAG